MHDREGEPIALGALSRGTLLEFVGSGAQICGQGLDVAAVNHHVTAVVADCDAQPVDIAVDVLHAVLDSHPTAWWYRRSDTTDARFGRRR
jgi:hypothetical protein